jgi:hypothetical protein
MFCESAPHTRLSQRIRMQGVGVARCTTLHTTLTTATVASARLSQARAFPSTSATRGACGWKPSARCALAHRHPHATRTQAPCPKPSRLKRYLGVVNPLHAGAAVVAADAARASPPPLAFTRHPCAPWPPQVCSVSAHRLPAHPTHRALWQAATQTSSCDRGSGHTEASTATGTHGSGSGNGRHGGRAANSHGDGGLVARESVQRQGGGRIVVHAERQS